MILIFLPSKAEVLEFIGWMEVDKAKELYGAHWRGRTSISIIYCHLMTFQNKVDVVKLLEMPGNYGKICSQLRLQQLFECVCNNWHAGSNESLQIPDISKDLSYVTAETMINMGIMLVYKILHVSTKYSYALHSHIHYKWRSRSQTFWWRETTEHNLSIKLNMLQLTIPGA